MIRFYIIDELEECFYVMLGEVEIVVVFLEGV